MDRVESVLIPDTLDPLSSEHAVLGSAGKASVFGTEASDVRRPCLYGVNGVGSEVAI